MVSNPFQDGLSVTIDGDASGFNETADGLTDRLMSLEGLVTGLGLAIAKLSADTLSDFISKGSDWEEQLANIDRVTDSVDINEIDEQLKDLNTTMPISIDQLGKLTEAGGRLGLEGDDLLAFTENVGKLASVTGIAEEELGNMVPRVLTLLDIDPSQIEEFGSALVWVGQNAGASEDELLDVGVRAGGAAEQAGIAEDEFFGLAGAMLEVSPTSRQAAGGLDRMFSAIQDPSLFADFAELLGVTEEEFKQMVESDPSGTIEQIGARMAEGGDKVDEFHSNTNAFSKDFATFGQNVGRVGELQQGANEQFEEGAELQSSFATQTDTFNSKVQIAKDRLHNMAIASGENLLPALSSLADMFGDLILWLGNLNEATDGWLGIIVGLSGVVGGLAAAGWGLVSMLGGAGAAMGIASGAATGLATAIGTVAAPILALIGVVALLAKAWQTDFAGIQTRTMEVVGVLQEALQPAIDWLQSDGVSILERIQDAFVTFVDIAEPYISILVDALADGLIWTIETAADVFGTAFDVISTVITTAWDSVLRPFLDWSARMWDEHLSRPVEEAQQTFAVWSEKIDEIISWVQDNVLGPFLMWFDEKFGEVLARVGDWWDEHGDRVMEIVGFLFDTVQRVVEGFIAHVSDVFSAFFALLRGDWSTFGENVESIVDRLVGGVVDLFSWLWEKVTGWVSDLKDDVIGSVTDMKNDFEDAVDELTDNALQTVKDFAGDFLDAGKGLVDAIVDGIKDSPGKVKDAVEDVVGDARDMLPFSDAKEGPFADLTESGASIPETLASGVYDNIGALVSALRELETPQPDVGGAIGAAAGGAGAGTHNETNQTFNIEVHSPDPQQAGENVMGRLRREMDSGF